MQNLIRRCILQLLTRLCTVCQCLTKWFKLILDMTTKLNEEALAIRCIFSLVDMIKLNFQIALMILKFVCLGSIICIVSIKISFKAVHHLQSLENLRFLPPPLILRLYTGCRLDQNFSKSIIGFQKVKELDY